MEPTNSEHELPSQPVDRNGYGIAEVAERNNTSPSTIYREIKSGRLRARKLGSRTLITRDDEAAWLTGLPAVGTVH